MKITIYVDILILLNFIINSFLITITAKFLGVIISKKRLFLSSFIGSLFSIIILLPTLSIIMLNISKLFISIVICFIAFSFRNKKVFLKSILTFYIVSFIFGGFMFSLFTIFDLNNMIFHNGILYFKFSFIILIVSTLIIYLLLNFFIDVYGKNLIRQETYKVILKVFGKTFQFSGFLDTGNKLCDVNSGKPVVIISYDKIKSYMDNEIKNNIEKYFNNDLQNIKNDGKIKYIPYKTVAFNGILPSIDIEGIKIIGKNHVIDTNNVLLSITKNSFMNNQYDIILNSLMFT